jgi:hypothetical protein
MYKAEVPLDVFIETSVPNLPENLEIARVLQRMG